MIDWLKQISVVPLLMPYTANQGELDETTYYMPFMHWWITDRVLDSDSTVSDLATLGEAMGNVRSDRGITRVFSSLDYESPILGAQGGSELDGSLPPPPAVDDPSSDEYTQTPRSSDKKSEGENGWHGDEELKGGWTDYLPGNCAVRASGLHVSKKDGAWIIKCAPTGDCEDEVCDSLGVEVLPPVCPVCQNDMIWPAPPKAFLRCESCENQGIGRTGGSRISIGMNRATMERLKHAILIVRCLI